MDVYVDLDPDANFDSTPTSSFKKSTLSKMRYKEFLDKSGQGLSSIGLFLRDESDYIADALAEDIIQPSFFEEVTEPAGITLIQGAAGFDSSPKYESHEQFVCAIDGTMLVKLIPHIYRQEVYAGKERVVFDPEDKDTKSLSENTKEQCQPNESPVSFFQPDLKQYPLFDEAERKYLVILHEGDCVFIPAFYFHQFAAKQPSLPDREGRKPMATMIILRYKSNS